MWLKCCYWDKEKCIWKMRTEKHTHPPASLILLISWRETLLLPYGRWGLVNTSTLPERDRTCCFRWTCWHKILKHFCSYIKLHWIHTAHESPMWEMNNVLFPTNKRVAVAPDSSSSPFNSSLIQKMKSTI